MQKKLQGHDAAVPQCRSATEPSFKMEISWGGGQQYDSQVFHLNSAFACAEKRERKKQKPLASSHL
jgi:hypothetical protein